MSEIIEAEFTIVESTPTVEELAAKAAAEQEKLEQAAVQAEDVVVLINEYLSDKAALRDEDDCINIVNNSIHRWDFAHISCPTTQELFQLISVVKAKASAKQSNEEALAFLIATDHKILRHIGQQALGLATSLTASEYQELEQQRQIAREAIVK